MLFFHFSIEAYVMGTHKECFLETLLMSINNTCFHLDKKNRHFSAEKNILTRAKAFDCKIHNAVNLLDVIIYTLITSKIAKIHLDSVLFKMNTIIVSQEKGTLKVLTAKTKWCFCKHLKYSTALEKNDKKICLCQ